MWALTSEQMLEVLRTLCMVLLKCTVFGFNRWLILVVNKIGRLEVYNDSRA